MRCVVSCTSDEEIVTLYFDATPHKALPQEFSAWDELNFNSSERQELLRFLQALRAVKRAELPNPLSPAGRNSAVAVMVLEDDYKGAWQEVLLKAELSFQLIKNTQ